MKSTIQKKDDGTITLTIIVPFDVVRKTQDEYLESLTKTAQVPGFRKGKAPKKVVEQKVDSAKIKEEVLQKVLPKAYLDAISEHGLRPIINPKIHIESIEEKKDWKFTAVTCEAPRVDLGFYKKAISNVTAKSKIIISGKESTQKQEPSLDDIIKVLLSNVSVTIPDVLIEGEVDRLLSQMLDEIKTLGLSLDQYLASTKKTAQDLRDEYKKKAQNDIMLEFTLQKVAETEKIAVEEKEIDEAIQKAKDEKEKQHLSSNRYLLASILRQQKTLDFLKNL